jgi:hypothetical protein
VQAGRCGTRRGSVCTQWRSYVALLAARTGASKSPEICDLAGRYLGRRDFYWDEFGVVGEADEDLRYKRQDSALPAQRERQGLFEDTGLLVVSWGPDLFAFDRVIRRLGIYLARGARRGSPQRRWRLRAPGAFGAAVAGMLLRWC